MGWTRKAAVGLLALCALAGAATIFRGPGPLPVPKDKSTFIGIWEDGTGLTLEFTPDGHAAVAQAKNAKVDSAKSAVRPAPTGRCLAYFRPEDRIELTTGLFGNSKFYQIDRYPFMHEKKIKMVLNDTDPYKREGGVIFVKKTGP